MDKLMKVRQMRAAMEAFASQAAANLTDDAALKMAAAFPVWPSGTDENGQYAEGQIVQHGDGLYRVMQPVAPQAHQPPDGEGMLAVYRPVSPSHAGTLEDPIPWVYGMDCTTGNYYSYNGTVYRCAGDMIPCVWYPDSGIWQWEEVTAEEPEPEPEEPEGGGETEPDEPEPGGETEEGGTDEPAEPSEPDGTLESPIPFELNMNAEEGKYYIYESKVYLCKADMSPCVWAPGTAGLWQWEEVV